jgi:hypothetical protein
MQRATRSSRASATTGMAAGLLCFCLVAAISGCATTGAKNTGRADAVEYTFTRFSDRVHVYLTASGAARIDTLKADELRTVRTVFAPANADEVRELAAALDALIPSLPAARADSAISFSEAGEGMYVRSVKAGRERRAHLSIAEMNRSGIWEGVAQEIEAAAHVDLAEAIFWHDLAERHLEQQEPHEALFAYELAVRHFTDWAVSRVFRYDVLWEPETMMAFTYPNAADEQRRWTIHGAIPSRVMDIEGMTEEWAIKFLQYGWDTYTRGIKLTRLDDAVVLSLEPGGVNGFYDWWRSVPIPRPAFACGLTKASITPADIEVLKKARPSSSE